ncbi:MAG: SRPBCC family protein [Cryomorphaceae bacterium]|nr:SRPBCC family protein [Cryomorphaceae bacterium]
MFQQKDSVWVAEPLETVWNFFSQPKNLQKITPSEMGFETVNEMPDTMYAGMMIHHKVRPIAGIKLNWITEISHLEPLRYFVDEQRFGPFAMWHHEHHFAAENGGTTITDIISYKLPLGKFGALFHSVLVKPKIKAIFAFRKEKVELLFGVKTNIDAG